MTGSVDELQSLRAEVAALRREVESLRASPRRPEAPSTRRGFLRLAGAAAAGATVVAGSTVAAESGEPVIIGAANRATQQGDITAVIPLSTTTLMTAVLGGMNYTNTGFPATPANHRIGVAGECRGDDDTGGFRTGVFGRALNAAGPGGQGVFGTSNGPLNGFTGLDIGVAGSAPGNGFGVLGFTAGDAAGGAGVKGSAPAGTGVLAESSAGVSLRAAGGGRILQDLRAAGAPTAGSFAAGEMIRDAGGDMYLCISGGAPGTWRKVTAQHPAYAGAGGSVNLLATPIRLVDTRHDPAVPFDNGGSPLTPGAPFSVQVTGTVAQGLSVPTGATGIIGNLTVTQAFGPGYALLWPSGPPPATSSINYTQVTVGPGALANSFVCGLDPAGRLNLMCAVNSTHAILDVAGFTF